MFASVQKQSRSVWRARGFAFTAALGLVAFAGFACAAAEQGDDPQDVQNLLAISTYLIQDSGNCVQSVRQGTNLGRLSCSRTPLINCALDRRIDLAGNTIVTATTQSRYRTAWARLVDTYPKCSAASAASFSLSAFRTSTSTQISNLKQSNFQVVADCDALNGQNGPALINRVEHDFVFSPRGVMAGQALNLSRVFVAGGGTGEDVSGTCFRELIDFAWEETVLNNIADGNRSTEKTCLYGSLSGGTQPCSTEQKAVAYPFDFSLPL